MTSPEIALRARCWKMKSANDALRNCFAFFTTNLFSHQLNFLPRHKRIRVIKAHFVAVEIIPHLAITFHRNQAVGWSPVKPSMQSKRTAQSGWRSSTTFSVESIWRTLCRCRARGSNCSRSHYVDQALLRKEKEKFRRTWKWGLEEKRENQDRTGNNWINQQIYEAHSEFMPVAIITNYNTHQIHWCGKGNRKVYDH